MALNAEALASIIKTNISAIEDGYKDGEKSADAAYLAIANAFIEHITSSAEVRVTGGSSSGVYKVE